MGLFSNLSRAARQLESSGLLNKIKDVVEGPDKAAGATGTGGGTVPRPQPAEGPLSGLPADEVVRLAVQRGAPDVAAALSVTQVAAVLGARVGEPAPYYEDEWIGWIWTAADDPSTRVEVRAAFFVTNGTPHEPDDLWNGYLRPQVAVGAADVPGLGDDAFRDGNTVFCRVGDAILLALGHPRSEDLLRAVVDGLR